MVSMVLLCWVVVKVFLRGWQIDRCSLWKLNYYARGILVLTKGDVLFGMTGFFDSALLCFRTSSLLLEPMSQCFLEWHHYLKSDFIGHHWRTSLEERNTVPVKRLSVVLPSFPFSTTTCSCCRCCSFPFSQFQSRVVETSYQNRLHDVIIIVIMDSGGF